MDGKGAFDINIAAYCRVSTDKEDQLNSLEIQKAFFIGYAEKSGHQLVRLYADEGLSGTKVKHRRQFQQMLSDAEQGLFDMLVVKDISRLARNTVDLLQSVRRLKALGIQTLFLTANMTSLGDSEFILTVFGALAQEESANMSKRIKFGKRMNAERGRVPNLVYGYDKTAGDIFHLTVNPAEARTVRQIYHWYIHDGWGGSRIASMLNQQGLRTKRNCAWNQTAVCRILTNPLYTGTVINGKEEICDFLTSTRREIDAEHWLVTERPDLQIVSSEAFQQAGEIMAARERMFHQERRRHSGKYLFSTLIRCKACGWSFRRISRTYRSTYVRWVCSRRNGQGSGQCENAVSVREDVLIAQLDAYFQSLLQNRRQIAQAVRRALKRAGPEGGDAQARRRELQTRLNQLERSRQKHLDLYTDDLITRQELERRLTQTRAEVGQLEEQLRRLAETAEGAAAADELADRLFQNLSGYLTVQNLNNAQLKQLIEKIEVDGEETVDVYLRLSPQPSGAAGAGR